MTMQKLADQEGHQRICQIGCEKSLRPQPYTETTGS